MRHVFLLVLFCSFFSFESRLASQSLEVGGTFGVSGYIGDLHEPYIEMLEVHKAYGFFTRFNISHTLALKLSLLKGEVSGNDANYATIEKHRFRNLSFRSPIYECSLQGELNFLKFGSGKRPLAKAYLFSGISGFYFNPQANYEGNWYDLQPLGTEGQGMAGYGEKYKLFQASVPFGFGFRVLTTEKSSFGLEFGLRKTFTDYIDDVSSAYPDIQALQEVNQMAAALSYRSPEVEPVSNSNPMGTERGSHGNDMYFFGGVTISIVIAK